MLLQRLQRLPFGNSYSRVIKPVLQFNMRLHRSLQSRIDWRLLVGILMGDEDAKRLQAEEKEASCTTGPPELTPAYSLIPAVSSLESQF